MDNYIVKKMDETDLEKVFQIEKRVFSDAWDKEMFYSEINHDSYVLVNNIYDEIIGYLCGWRIIDEYLINNLAIDIPYRRKGLGEFLLADIISKQIQNNVLNFFLEVRKSNLPAINLYSKLGFKVLRIRKKYYKDPIEDAFEMGAFYGN